MINPKTLLRQILRDTVNFSRYGLNAPKSFQRIWVNPMECNFACHSKDCFDIDPNYSSAKIISKWPSDKFIEIESLEKIIYCRKHWEDFLSWEDVGAFKRIQNRLDIGKVTDHNLSSIDQIKLRFEKLDHVFNEVMKEGRLKTSYEKGASNLIYSNREYDGILIHIGPNFEPIFGLKGSHRFSIAKITNTIFPAQLGIIHKDAIQHLVDLKSPF